MVVHLESQHLEVRDSIPKENWPNCEQLFSKRPCIGIFKVMNHRERYHLISTSSLNTSVPTLKYIYTHTRVRVHNRFFGFKFAGAIS